MEVLPLPGVEAEEDTDDVADIAEATAVTEEEAAAEVRRRPVKVRDTRAESMVERLRRHQRRWHRRQ